jgi:threonine aldolase
MVYLNLSEDLPVDVGQIVEKLKKLGVLVDGENARRFRLVTHYWIDEEAVEKTVAAFSKSLA